MANLAVAYRSSLWGASGALVGTTFGVGKPAGVQDGDALVVAMAQTSPAGATPPAGWALAQFSLTGGTVQGFYIVFTKQASGEPANYTFTGAAGQSYNWVITAWSGVDTNVSPFQSSPISVGTGSPINTPVLNTLRSNCRILPIVFAGPKQVTDVGSPPDFGYPAGTTIRAGQSDHATTLAMAVAIGDDNSPQGPAGPTTSRAIINANTASPDGSCTMALAPLQVRQPAVSALYGPSVMRGATI